MPASLRPPLRALFIKAAVGRASYRFGGGYAPGFDYGRSIDARGTTLAGAVGYDLWLSETVALSPVIGYSRLADRGAQIRNGAGQAERASVVAALWHGGIFLNLR